MVPEHHQPPSGEFDLDAQIDAALSRPMRRFPARLEARYLRDTQADRRAELALYGRLGPAVYGLHVLFDLIAHHQPIWVAALVRGCLTSAGLLAVEFLLRGPPRPVCEGLIGPACTLLALAGMAVMSLHAPFAEGLLVLDGVLLAIVFGNLCMPGPFRVKLAANLLYVLCALVTVARMPAPDVMAGIVMLLTGQSLTLAVAQRLELQKRRNHLLTLRALRRVDALAARNDHLQALSERDALTSLLNRRGLDVILLERLEEAARDARPLGIVMIDVDHFKPFNDRYGHQAGDECLRTVGAILSAYTRRETDHVGRFGGEEFLALLPGRDLAGTIGTAERLRRAIEGADIEHERGGAQRRVTASFGAACAMPGAGLSAQALVMEADRALYLAKSAGRNCVMPSTALSASEAMLDQLGPRPHVRVNEF